MIGAHASAVTQARNYSDRWTTLENYRLSVELLRQGRLHTEGLISHRVPADAALGIHAALAARPARAPRRAHPVGRRLMAASSL